MMKAVNFTKVQLFTRDGYILTNEETEFFRRMVVRRAGKGAGAVYTGDVPIYGP